MIWFHLCHTVLVRHVGPGRWIRASSEGTFCNSHLCKNCPLCILLSILLPRDYISELSHCLYLTTRNLRKNGFVLLVVQGAQSHHSDKKKRWQVTLCLSGSREESMPVLLQLSVFNSLQKPDLWNGTTHIQGGPSYLNYLLQIIHHRGYCQGGFNYHQDDSQNYPLQRWQGFFNGAERSALCLPQGPCSFLPHSIPPSCVCTAVSGGFPSPKFVLIPTVPSSPRDNHIPIRLK